MELEKMNNSIEEMEEIVSKMKSIKDSYVILQKSSMDIENLVKIFEIRTTDLKDLESKVEKSFTETFKANEELRSFLGKNSQQVLIEMLKLNESVHNNLNEKENNIIQNIEGKSKQALVEMLKLNENTKEILNKNQEELNLKIEDLNKDLQDKYIKNKKINIISLIISSLTLVGIVVNIILK